jgi:hypothetical protein
MEHMTKDLLVFGQRRDELGIYPVSVGLSPRERPFRFPSGLAALGLVSFCG